MDFLNVWEFFGQPSGENIFPSNADARKPVSTYYVFSDRFHQNPERHPKTAQRPPKGPKGNKREPKVDPKKAKGGSKTPKGSQRDKEYIHTLPIDHTSGRDVT